MLHIVVDLTSHMPDVICIRGDWSVPATGYAMSITSDSASVTPPSQLACVGVGTGMVRSGVARQRVRSSDRETESSAAVGGEGDVQ